MYHLVLLIVLILSSMNSYACNKNEDPEQPKRRCSYLEIVVQYATENMIASVRAVEKAENIPESRKVFFREEQDRFQKTMEENCKDNLECVRDHTVKRIGQIKKFYCDYHHCLHKET